MSDDLEALPNIGPVLAAELRAVGIESPEELVRIGSVSATLRLARGSPVVRYNLLYALEGAVRGVRWHALPRPDREALKERLREEAP
jgi:DNA transformation protein